MTTTVMLITAFAALAGLIVGAAIVLVLWSVFYITWRITMSDDT